MKDVVRHIGHQRIDLVKAEHIVYVTFDYPDLPTEVVQLTFTNAEDTLTGFWVCCKTAEEQEAEYAKSIAEL